MTARPAHVRAQERDQRLEEAREVWEERARAAVEESAKTERLRAARLALKAEQEMRQKPIGKKGGAAARPSARPRGRAAQRARLKS